MAEKLEFELVSPEKLLISTHATMVVVPGSEGDFGAMPRHAPLLTAVRPGVIDIYDEAGLHERIFVAGGFAEVNEVRCTVLAEEAIPVGEIDRPTVKARHKAARELVEEADDDVKRAIAKRAVAVADAMTVATGFPAEDSATKH